MFWGGSGNNFMSNTFSFNTKKRAAPTVTSYDGAGTANKIDYHDGSWHNGGSVLVLAYTGNFNVQANGITSCAFVCNEMTAECEL